MLLSRHQATQNQIVKYKYYDKKKMLSSVFFVCLSVLFFSLKVQGFQGSNHAFLASAGGKKGPTLRFPYWPPHNVHAAQTTKTKLAWPCVPCEKQSDPQGHLLWSTCFQQKTLRSPPADI